MFITGLAAYASILVIARLLGRVAKLPVLGIGNALGGAVVGLRRKARCSSGSCSSSRCSSRSRRTFATGLHESRLAPYLVTYDAPIDDAMLSTIPWFARPFVMPYFKRHHL